MSQEAGIEAQALTDPDEDKVYHANSVDDITFMKKKSKVEIKRSSDDDDDCEDESAENGAKKGNVVHKDVKPIPKSGIIKLDTDKPENFVESIQIDADDNVDKKVKKSSSGLISPFVEQQKQKIQTLQASIHKNLVKLFHHLKHSHPQNNLSDQQEVAQAKEALIADAKRMTALNHNRSPAEDFLSGLSNNTLISKMLQDKKKPNLITLDSAPGNGTGVNTSKSASNAGGKEDSSFEVKVNEEAKPDSHEGSSNVEIKTSGDVKSSGDGSTNIEVKNDGQSSFSSEGGNKASTSQGSSGTEIKSSSNLDSIDLAMKSSNDKPEGNESKVNNKEDNSKVTPSESNSSSNSNKTAKLGKFSLDKKEENVSKIKVKEVKENESDENPNIKHDPYAEIAASPDDPKLPPNIKLPKEGPYIPVGMPKNDDDDDDDEPPRDKGKERETDKGRGGGGGGGGAPFIPPPGKIHSCMSISAIQLHRPYLNSINRIHCGRLPLVQATACKA